MSRPLKHLPLLTLTILLGAVVAAHGITWSTPTFPFYASTTEHGPMYFTSTFTADVGNWTAGLLMFYNMSYAGSTTWTSIGYAAQNDTTFTLLEASPTSHVLMNTGGTGALRNVTLYLPVSNVVNVTNVDAYTWDNATHLLEITTALGPALVRISFVAGSGLPVEFIVPAWFINLGGTYFGIADFFGQLILVMNAFVAWFTGSITNVIGLIYWIMTALTFMAGAVIDWLGRIVGFLVNLFTIIASIFDGTYTAGLPNIWTIFNVSAWIDFIPVALFILWFDGLGKRARQSGQGYYALIVGDVQKMMYVVELVWGWSWTIFNFVYGVVMQFVGLLWGLIP